MKIITQDQVQSLSARFSPLTAEYPVTNLQDQHPGKLWISQSTSECLKLNCRASVAALFLGNASFEQAHYLHLKTASISLSALSPLGTNQPLTLTTSSPHGLNSGDLLYLEELGGTWGLHEQVFQAEVLSATQLKLLEPQTKAPILGTDQAAYTGGGTLRRCFQQGTLDFRVIETYLQFLQDQVKVYHSYWEDLPYSYEPSEVRLWVKNRQNRQHTPTQTLQSWARQGSSGSSGRFLQGSTPVQLNSANETFIRLGDCLTFSEFTKSLVQVTHQAGQNLTLSTSAAHGFQANDRVRLSGTSSLLDEQVFLVNNPTATTFEITCGSGSTQFWNLATGALSGSVSKLFQITSLKGDGTGSDAVTLSASPGASASVTGVYRSVQAGIMRCGYTKTFPNPQGGFQESRQDYSLRQEVLNGGMLLRKRHLLKQWQGQLQFKTIDDLNEFLDFADSQGPLGFACLPLHGVPNTQRFALYGHLSQAPQHTLESYQARQVGFTLRELI